MDLKLEKRTKIMHKFDFLLLLLMYFFDDFSHKNIEFSIIDVHSPII